MLLFFVLVKGLAEIALLAFVGQFLLGLLVGPKRDANVFYKLLSVLTSPFVTAVRWITPGFVLQRHLPLAAFCLLLAVWLFATLSKVFLCVQLGLEMCR